MINGVLLAVKTGFFNEEIRVYCYKTAKFLFHFTE